LRPELCIIQSNPASHRRPAFPSSIQRPRLPRLGMTPTRRIWRGALAEALATRRTEASDPR